MSNCAPSLKWHLMCRLTALQAAFLTALAVLIVVLLWMSGHLAKLEPEDDTIDAIASSVVRDGDGALAVRDTYTLEHRRKEISDFWFVLRDRDGRTLIQGPVPTQYAGIGEALDSVGQAKLGGKSSRRHLGHSAHQMG